MNEDMYDREVHKFLREQRFERIRREQPGRMREEARWKLGAMLLFTILAFAWLIITAGLAWMLL